jgi:hypothetical protein
MTIPANATQAGQMEGNGFTPTESQCAAFDALLPLWQEAVNKRHYDGFTHPADQVHGHYGKKYARLDIGGSGAFMVEIGTGSIFAIKGYGKVDLKKNVGNAYDPNFDAAVLVRDRFRHGRFTNHPDGSYAKEVL